MNFLRKSPQFIKLLWQVPLAALSFVFYRVMRTVLSRLYRWSLGRKSEAELQWRVLSGETIATVPLALPVLMTTGPRWNTHAVIGTLGPFRVAQSLELDLSQIQRSARSWVAVVYAFPSYETIQSLDSHALQTAIAPAAEPWVSIDIPPGRYTLGVRYYDCAEAIAYPSVRLDGTRVLPSLPADPNTNQFYHQLKAYPHKGLYRAMHYYSYILLKYRRYLSEAWVRREYLPVGAPDTQFFYGGLDRGQTLVLTVAPNLLDQFDFYVTLYDWSSFPVVWQRLQASHSEIAMPENGSYACRVRPKASTAATFGGQWPVEVLEEVSGENPEAVGDRSRVTVQLGAG